MKILIVSATRLEVLPLLSYLGIKEVQTSEFISTKHNNTTIDILITGIGLMHTSYHLSSILEKKQYNLAINVGISGSYNKDIFIGNIVNVVKEQVADQGAEMTEGFQDIFDLNFEDKNRFPYNNGILQNLSTTQNEQINTLHKVNGITVNRVISDQDHINKVVSKYRPDIESMEGAAFFYASLYAKIPFFEIRSISNYVEDIDRNKWDIQLAVNNLNKKTISIIKSL